MSSFLNNLHTTLGFSLPSAQGLNPYFTKRNYKMLEEFRTWGERAVSILLMAFIHSAFIKLVAYTHTRIDIHIGQTNAIK